MEMHDDPLADREALLERLRDVGLNRYESSVYLGLLTDQDAKVAEISKRTRVPQPKVYQALDSLVEKGFCSLGSDAVNRFRPVPPRVALEAFVNTLREREAAAHDLAGGLEDLLQAGKGQKLWAPPVEIVKGMRQVKRVLVDAIGDAREEILCFCKGPQVAAVEVAQALHGAADRGVRLRLLSDRSYYDGDESQAEQIELYRQLRGEKRELASVPTKMVLADRQLAVVSIFTTATGGEEDFLIMVMRQEGLVEHFLSSFWHSWEMAQPFRAKARA